MEKKPSIHIISAGKYPKDLRKYIAFQGKKHRLFSPNGGLLSIYNAILSTQEDDARLLIAMVSVDGIPVGIAYFNDPYIWIFVKKCHRRQGIGTKLVKYMQTKKSIRVLGHTFGTLGGTKFFGKLGLLKKNE